MWKMQKEGGDIHGKNVQNWEVGLSQQIKDKSWSVSSVSVALESE